MTIKEVSEKYGISQDTLRYYERVNVIPKVTRTSGGIRDYQEAAQNLQEQAWECLLPKNWLKKWVEPLLLKVKKA